MYHENEIIVTIVLSSSLMVFLVSIIVLAVVKYQNKARKHLLEVNELKIKYQEETIKAQVEKEEQTLNRISQEIHDNIGQILSLVKLNLNTMEMNECSADVHTKMLATRDLVGKAINDLRALSKSLNSRHLVKEFLSESLQRELEIINRSGIYTTRLSVNGEEASFDPQKQLILFRIVQELLNNIIKHARASTIQIILNYDSAFLNLSVNDNGTGFTTNPNEKSGTGLGNVYHRAKLIDADIRIESEKGAGTTVLLKIPTN